jgi:hypothetical protein
LVLAPNRPDTAAEIVEHKINILIIARRHDRGGPIGPTHYATPSTNRIQADGSRVVAAGFRCLIPAAPAVPAAAANQQNDKYDDEKRGGIHVELLLAVPCVFRTSRMHSHYNQPF